MLPNRFLVRRKVNTVDFVLGDVTVEPLNLRPYFVQGLQGMLRYLSDFCLR